jgi:putative spermidine/putrescine transport system ATP-binding protein
VTELEALRTAHPGELLIAGAVKRFGSVEALRGVDIEVRAGEFITLLGPSGSGKTTLLNAIAGFESLDAGSISLDGHFLGDLPPNQRGFGMVFQSYALFPSMTVLENVMYPLRVRGVPAADRQKQAGALLELVELGGLGARMPAQLSGGQQQRVALARALVFQPPVLLMDEPLGALDRRLRQSLQFAIKRIHRELRPTVVYVTHDQEEALAMSDRIAVLHRGLVEQLAAPADLYRHPRTQFVASFLGETNLLKVLTASRQGDRALIREEATGETFWTREAVPDGRFVLGVRPENWDAKSAVDQSDHGIGVTVASRTFMGDSWRYECLTSGRAPLILRIPDRDQQFSEGVQLRIEPKRGGLMTFEPE